ncbi:MAG: cytochrome c3 family protein [Anaerolineae bacterium]
MQHLDPAECSRCHPEKFSQWGRSRHYVNSCENCHGPARAHLQTGAQLAVETSPDLCKGCHGMLASRPGDFPQVDSQQHAGGWTCVSCHNPHQPEVLLQAEDQGPTPPEVPHSLEGRDRCLACHAAGPGKPPPEDHAGRTSEICLGCHLSVSVASVGSQTPVLKALTSSFPRIPHHQEGRSNCLLCHDQEGLVPFPEDHAGRTNDMCLDCHTGK